MSKRVWLEVALNGGWTRKRQPLIPVSRDELTEEAIRCVNAGAAVIHLHAYDENLGHQNDDPVVFADVIKNIKREVDAIVYPTVGQLPTKPDSVERYAPIETLCREGLLEWSVIDPGSVNFSNFEDIKKISLVMYIPIQNNIFETVLSLRSNTNCIQASPYTNPDLSGLARHFSKA